MSYEVVEAFRCVCDGCGHRWTAELMPLRCARCKSRKWDGAKPSAAISRRTYKKEATAPPRSESKFRTDSKPDASKDAAATAGQRRNNTRQGYDHATYLSLKPSDQLRYLREHPRT